MPLVMYEQISGNKYSQGTFIDRLGQQPILSAFVLDHRILKKISWKEILHFIKNSI
jgi:hypothetical protein